MISKMALDDLAQMERDGLHPTAADIIRLNAIGCKLDRGASGGLDRFQRTATVAGVTLYEPTIAHDLLAGALSKDFDMSNYPTFICVRAFVSHFPPGEVPSEYTTFGMTAAVEAFMRDHFQPITFKQLDAAVNYVLFGHDSAALEHPERLEEESGLDESAYVRDTADEHDETDPRAKVAVGVLHHAESLALGISVADAMRHTTSELYEICERATALRLRNSDARRFNEHLRERDTRLLGEYGDTRDAIRARLTRERGETAAPNQTIPNH